MALFAKALTELRELRETEELELDETVRARAPGKFIELERGLVHYDLTGPEEGQTVALLGGATIGMWFWDRTIQPLVAAGFRVLRFDFFGRGFSDRPYDPQTPAFFTDQIDQILDRLSLNRPVHLVGIAMSALSAIHYAELKPQSVASMSLLTPDGLGTATGPLTELMLVPGVGDYLFELFGAQAITQRLRAYSSDQKITTELLGRTAEELKIKGYKRSVLSGLRHMPVQDDSATMARVAAHKVPTLVIWGDQDPTTFDAERYTRMSDLMPHAESHLLRTGHLPQYEAPHLVNPLLVDFLQRASVKAIAA
ncbi:MULTISPECIES: alpha/beta fold hydrolase [Bradyrhizobium]|uniref:alpha/beta fold hydrolase n=1 Tax=Bradyrhizobium TaxID=374 RepID=UPI00131D5C01|nr:MULTISPECIES: alpha/beta fold hydrolase [Bradyrhizobium]UFW46473.1 alpha/beta fold hydrolase [Bradyrhizobium arachidis]